MKEQHERTGGKKKRRKKKNNIGKHKKSYYEIKRSLTICAFQIKTRAALRNKNERENIFL